MTQLKALLWDVDGTLAETERDGHRVAFNQAFVACGLAWCWDEAYYGELLRITGGRERVLHHMAMRAEGPASADERGVLASKVHAKKNELYADLVRRAGLPLRGGVLELLDECRSRGVRLGIATTTSRSNVEVLLHAHLGDRWADWFPVMVCGEDVQRKKPDPEVYVRALRELNISPLEAVAIEDSPGGVAAARAADVPVVVALSSYFADAAIEGAIAIGPGLHERRGWRPALPQHADASAHVRLSDIESWHAQMDSVSRYG